jgi:hypothetical protein
MNRCDLVRGAISLPPTAERLVKSASAQGNRNRAGFNPGSCARNLIRDPPKKTQSGPRLILSLGLDDDRILDDNQI